MRHFVQRSQPQLASISKGIFNLVCQFDMSFNVFRKKLKHLRTVASNYSIFCQSGQKIELKYSFLPNFIIHYFSVLFVIFSAIFVIILTMQVCFLKKYMLTQCIFLTSEVPASIFSEILVRATTLLSTVVRKFIFQDTPCSKL